MTAQRKIEIARRYLPEAEAIAQAADAERIPFAAACAVAEQESGGRMVYGHDIGGIFSTRDSSVTIGARVYPKGSDIPVTPQNAGLFLLNLGAGKKSNGLGIVQITYGPYFRQMLEEDELIPWIPEHNCRKGFRILRLTQDRTGEWARTFGHYNGGTVPDMEYGRDVDALRVKWKKAFDE